MTRQQLDEIKARHGKATAELDRLCNGGKFIMCVPVQETDTDILINHSLQDVADLVAEVDRLRAALQQIAEYEHIKAEWRDRVTEIKGIAQTALEDQP